MKTIIIGQSGGPTCAINSSLAGIFKGAKDEGVDNIYGMVHGIQGLLNDEYLDMKKYIKNDLDVELLKRTPASYLGSCRVKLPDVKDDESVYKRAFEFIDKHKVDAFFYIGGNDSMDTINKLSKYGRKIKHPCRFVGCPKTIDNDLAMTDHTPGYGSAAKYIATSVKEVIRDSMCLRLDRGQVVIMEVMGRSAGWLTAATALSKGEDCEGPDLIYLPEKVFDVEDFLKRVEDLLAKKPNVFVAVSEGVKVEDGRYVCELDDDAKYVDAFGHKQLSGTASYLCRLVAGKLGCKTRPIELSTLQRAAIHLASETDIQEGYQAGYAALEHAMKGETGKMITLKRESNNPYVCTIEAYDTDVIANEERLVPYEMISEDGTNITKEFITYARPLIQGELTHIVVDGVTRHLPVPRELR